MPRERPKMTVPSTPNRTRIGTGKDVLAGIDGRTAPARRFREIVGQLVSNIGGDPSQAQTAVIQRAATLLVWAESAEAEFARTGELDIGSFTTATNALRRLLADVGLERKTKDVTPSLDVYLAARSRASDAGDAAA